MHLRHLLSAPHRILAARCEQKTCVAHQYSIVKDRPEKLRNQPPQRSDSLLLSSNIASAARCPAVSCRVAPLLRAERLQRLVGLGRVELPTSPLSGVRSSHLSYRPITSGGVPRFSAAEPLQNLVELVGIEPATS